MDKEERDKELETLDMLATGAIEDNMACLTGDAVSVKKVDNIFGYPFAGYIVPLETKRRSDVTDKTVVLVPGAFPPPIGEMIVKGQVGTIKDRETGRVLVHVLAEQVFDAAQTKTIPQNDVALKGVIARPPKYRVTPKGRAVTELFLETKNSLTGGTSYIPCICWNENACEAAKWQLGDILVLTGRMQSRDYVKRLEESTEIRTAYEVSARMIKRIEEGDKEKAAERLRQLADGSHTNHDKEKL